MILHAFFILASDPCCSSVVVIRLKRSSFFLIILFIEANQPEYEVRPEEDSIIVSIAAYRDNGLHQTLKDLVDQAKDPDKLYVALVQQYCTGGRGVSRKMKRSRYEPRFSLFTVCIARLALGCRTSPKTCLVNLDFLKFFIAQAICMGRGK